VNSIVDPQFSPKDPAEIITLGFDFAALTSTPSSPVFTVTRLAGAADPDPSALKSGAASISGTKALQKIVGGVSGCRYLIECQVDAPDGSRYVLTGVLPVVEA